MVKALVSHSESTPLMWADLPDRPLRPDEVRVETRAVGVNPVDWKMRGFSLLSVLHSALGPSGPFVCGIDFAGVVTEVGSAVTDPKVVGAVTDLKVGDRVVGGTDFSRRQRGTYARQVQVRADQVAVLPDDVSFDAAACLPVAGVTAQTCLFDLGRLPHTPRGRALVLGASGGVGHFAIQLARRYGGTAVGVCSQRNVALVERLGAVAVDYSLGDPFAAVAKHGPYDVIVDAIGSATYPISRYKAVLRAGGKHVLVMPTPADYWRVGLQPGVRTVLGRPNRASLTPLVADLAAGKLEVVIAQRFPLDEAERAQTVSKEGRVVGKLVLVA
jgi:NADPH2:quinone reductase